MAGFDGLTDEELTQFVQLFLNDPTVYACYSGYVHGGMSFSQVLLKALVYMHQQVVTLRSQLSNQHTEGGNHDDPTIPSP